MNIRMRFSVWINLREEDQKYKYFQETVAQATTVVRDGWSKLRLPYLVAQPCNSYENYLVLWFQELKPKVDLCRLGLKNDDQLLDLLPQCYGAYMKAKEADVIELESEEHGTFSSYEDAAYRKCEVNKRSRKLTELFPTVQCIIRVGDNTYYVPYMLRGHCDNFEEYWSKWITQCGPEFDLKANRIYTGEQLEYIVKGCYREFCNMLKSADTCDLPVTALSKARCNNKDE